MKTMRERFRENINSYSQNDPFNLLSAVRAKYGEVVVSELLESIEDFIEQEIKKEREEIIEMIESLPAYTPLSDKTMSKVSDDAKKPRWGSNYLNREAVINTIKNRV